MLKRLNEEKLNYDQTEVNNEFMINIKKLVKNENFKKTDSNKIYRLVSTIQNLSGAWT